jgi:hypothetical protein
VFDSAKNKTLPIPVLFSASVVLREKEGKMIEAWQVRKGNLIPYAHIHPIPTVALPPVASYTEAGLHAHSLSVRCLEITPPIVPRFPVGSWVVDTFGELSQLREYALDDPQLSFPEGDPCKKFCPWPPRQRWVVEKYHSWLLLGSEPPPLIGIEMESGRIKIVEGHHRAEALVEGGRSKCQIWVAAIYIRPETGSGSGFTHELAVSTALHKGMLVPYEVLADYPHLKSHST